MAVAVDALVEMLKGEHGPAVAAGAMALAAAAGGFLFLWAASALRRQRAARRARRGLRLEGRAADLLSEHGYEVLGRQVPGEIELALDGRRFTAPIRTDFIVRKRGRILAADSKSGAAADNPLRPDVRRQLLEYCLVHGCDGGLVVDMNARRVREVRFRHPALRPAGLGPAGAVLLALLCGLAGFLVGWAFC